MIGLGYVGLPLALALARHFDVVGFDISKARVGELRAHRDRTGEVAPSELKATAMSITADPSALKGVDVFIVTVPTPVDDTNKPDLGAVRAACATVGKVMRPGAIAVFESTVYPGVTEDICGPELERSSGLVCGKDFFLGYSPERINPGDREHTVDKITKVVAGQTPEVADRLKAVYGAVTGGNVFVAANIKTAEAAKVIENAQRDINIAFVNEVAMIFNKVGISTHDVLAAAGTKWNFLKFSPGFVGGHCIGVDPFYLAHLAEQLGHDPEVILAGRRINDGMAGFVAERIDVQLGGGPKRVLVLGLTFKENVPDLRNSKVADLVVRLGELGHDVKVHDPLADRDEAREHYGIELLQHLDEGRGSDCVVGAVPHAVYMAFSGRMLSSLVAEGGLVADLKGMWRHVAPTPAYRRWEL